MPTTKAGGLRAPVRIGGSNTYIIVDETNDTIKVYVNGSKVHEWS